MSPAHGGRAVPGSGPRPDVARRRGGAVDRERAVAQGGVWAFCSGGDQRIRGRTGYRYAAGETAETVDIARAGRLHILEAQRLIRFMPKVVICLVNGRAAGGGHSLHSTCDLTLASREHARFKQTDADVGSFDAATAARISPDKWARSSPARSSSWVGPTPLSRCIAWVRSTRSSITASWSRWVCSGPLRSTRNRLKRNGR